MRTQGVVVVKEHKRRTVNPRVAEHMVRELGWQYPGEPKKEKPKAKAKGKILQEIAKSTDVVKLDQLKADELATSKRPDVLEAIDKKMLEITNGGTEGNT